jgi:DNA-binding transcriptional regulator YdaS (Cro superfamily)
MNPYASSLAAYLAPDDRAQAALAAAIESTQASVSRYARGKRFPDSKTALAIDRATGGLVPFVLWQSVASRRLGISPESAAA